MERYFDYCLQNDCETARFWLIHSYLTNKKKDWNKFKYSSCKEIPFGAQQGSNLAPYCLTLSEKCPYSEFFCSECGKKGNRKLRIPTFFTPCIIFACDMFFLISETEFVSYADNNAPYLVSGNVYDIIKILENDWNGFQINGFR